MPIKFNLDKLSKEPQVLHLSLLQMLLASPSFKEMDGFFVEEGVYEDSGEVLLHQTCPENDKEEAERRKEYEDLARECPGLPPYDELVEFDDLIPLKANYTLQEVDGRCKMVFSEVSLLGLDEQMAYDEAGNLVLASELEEESAD